MELRKAERLCDEILGQLRPGCARIAIAGSVRRQKPDVGDLELVAVPREGVEQVRVGSDLFGDCMEYLPPLDAAIQKQLNVGWLKVLKDGPRYKQFALSEGINLDLFVVRPPAQWGVIYTIRTGPDTFSKWLVTDRQHGGALPSHLKVRDGGLYEGRQIIETPEESDFFEFIGLEWIEPSQREARWNQMLAK